LNISLLSDVEELGDLPAGQISQSECKLLYWLASNVWSGRGAIVEIGSLFGKSTTCLARGMVASGHETKGMLHCFDKWVLDDESRYMLKSRDVGESFYLEFLQNTERYRNVIVPHIGDVTKATWDTGIEILFIDCSVSLDVHKAIFKTFYPHLSRGSVIVHQDYIFYRSYYLPYIMQKVSRHCRRMGTVETSAVWQFDERIADCQINNPRDDEIGRAIESEVLAYGGRQTLHGAILACSLVYFYKRRGMLVSMRRAAAEIKALHPNEFAAVSRALRLATQ